MTALIAATNRTSPSLFSGKTHSVHTFRSSYSLSGKHSKSTRYGTELDHLSPRQHLRGLCSAQKLVL